MGINHLPSPKTLAKLFTHGQQYHKHKPRRIKAHLLLLFCLFLEWLTATDSGSHARFISTHLSERSTQLRWRRRWWRWMSAGGSSWRLSSPASTGTPGGVRRWAAGCSPHPGCVWAGRGAGGCPGSGWGWSARREEE